VVKILKEEEKKEKSRRERLKRRKAQGKWKEEVF
jgi:hypothetical protein